MSVSDLEDLLREVAIEIGVSGYEWEVYHYDVEIEGLLRAKDCLDEAIELLREEARRGG